MTQTTDHQSNQNEISFLNQALPPLKSGPYHLNATLTVDLKNGDAKPTFSNTQKIVITGPRFSLPKADIHMVYPPGNASGDFRDKLPMVVLNPYHLPWEQTAFGTNDPWIALLNFSADELAGIPIETMTLRELITGDTEVTAPELDTEDEDLEQKLMSVTLEKELLVKLAPRISELSYLAHVRQIRRQGTFERVAVVTANRLPVATKMNHALLVSLEGCKRAFEDMENKKDPKEPKLRLVVLAHWQFKCDAAEQGNVADLLENLDCGMLLPKQGDKQQNGKDQLAEEKAASALKAGYVPLTHRLRSGERTTSWYRGPFTPVATSRPEGEPRSFSDAALQFDPQTGLFNVSYAVAWQLGRLLALADPAIARSLADWRKANLLHTRQKRTTRQFAQALGDSAGQLKTTATDGSFNFNQDVAEIVKRFSINHLSPVLDGWVAKQSDGKCNVSALEELSLASLEKAVKSGEDPVEVFYKHSTLKLNLPENTSS